jgi:membrane associated rhomboid family serine protease
MTPTSVGMRCPECAGDSTKVRTPAFAASAPSSARATMVLIGINVLAYLAEVLTGSGGLGIGGSDVFADGSLCGNAVGDGGFCAARDLGLLIDTDGGEWWRVITGGFLHGSVIHLALNMFVLFVLGQVLEPAIGTPRFVAVYIVSLIAGSAGALLLSEPSQFTVGASGAVYGLFLATLIVAHSRGQDQVVAQLGFWLVLNLVLTFSVPGISVGGHIGGLVGGTIAALLVVGAERRIARRETLGAELGILAAIGVGCFVAAVVFATENVTL